MAKHLQCGDQRAVDRFSSILHPTRRTVLSLGGLLLVLAGLATLRVDDHDDRL